MKETRSMKHLLFPLLALSLVPWLAGCASFGDTGFTGHMWEVTGSNHREPAGNPNLKLYHTATGGEVLVRYDEELESSGAIKSRAFLLFANEKKLKNLRKPSFLSSDKAARIQSSPIPIVLEPDTNAMASEDLQAFILPDKHHFTLVSKDRYIGTYCLPTYGTVTTRGVVARALFLPATVAGDVTVCGAVVGAFAAYGLASSYVASHQ